MELPKKTRRTVKQGRKVRKVERDQNYRQPP